MRWLELSADELRQREPALSRRYTFGVLVEENGQCRDPGAYVAALVRHAVAQGAELRRARAQGFRIEGRRLVAVRAEGGEIAADKAVIAAGAWSQGAGRRGRGPRAAGDGARLSRRHRRPGHRAALSR